jgi:very-short-patch-repair endonuclease
VHQCQAEYDEARTKHLATFGYTIIRFDNKDIEDRMPEVLEEIKRTAHKLILGRKRD